jgi:predicted phage gp36 major capsid-like protein
MSIPKENAKGGFHFGSVGGGVNISAGGDVVGGDKTTTNITGAVTKGFAGDEQKAQFASQMDELRESLRAMKAQIEAHPGLSTDDKEAITAEILQQVKALKDAKDLTAAVPAGKEAPAQVAAAVETTLDQAGGVMDKLQGLAKKAGATAETFGQIAAKWGPLILSARHLFGLP